MKTRKNLITSMLLVVCMVFSTTVFAENATLVGCPQTRNNNIKADGSAVEVTVLSSRTQLPEQNSYSADAIVVNFEDIHYIASYALGLVNSGVSLYIVAPTVSRRTLSQILDIPLLGDPVYTKAILVGVYISKIGDLYVWTNHYLSGSCSPSVQEHFSADIDDNVQRTIHRYGTFYDTVLISEKIADGYFLDYMDIIAETVVSLVEHDVVVAETISNQSGAVEPFSALVPTNPNLTHIFRGTQTIVTYGRGLTYGPGEVMGQISATQYIFNLGSFMVNHAPRNIIDIVSVFTVTPTRNNAWVRQFDGIIDAAFAHSVTQRQELIQHGTLPSGNNNNTSVGFNIPFFSITHQFNAGGANIFRTPQSQWLDEIGHWTLSLGHVWVAAG